MKYAVVFVIAVAVFGIVVAEDAKKDTPAADGERPTVFKRLIPADVLRDFPGMCFASTRCATVEPGKTWELAPFCGRSTCIRQDEENPNHLLELVEDCGPLPIPNPKCKLDTEKTNKTAPFPGCCPIFTCEKGVELKYPEIPVPADAKPAEKPQEKPKA